MSIERAELISVLKAARAELVTKGRCKGRLVSEDGRVCARGAVASALVDDFGSIYLNSNRRRLGQNVAAWARALFRVPGLQFHYAVNELTRHLPAEFHMVELFNDDPDTTDQDVLNLFDKALADLGGLA